MDNPTASSTADIDAPAELVYDLVSDVPNTSQWTAETERCWWVKGATGPEVGARFRGRNRNRWAKWTTTSTVTAADRGKRFAFQVGVGGIPSARWEYLFEPTDKGCRVTESTRRLAPRPIANAVNRLLGVKDRDAHNQRNIEATLARLKEHAEQRARAV